MGAAARPEEGLVFPASHAYIERMANTAPIFDHEDEDARERALAEARDDLDAGHGVDNERVRAWLKDLAAGRRTPPPCE